MTNNAEYGLPFTLYNPKMLAQQIKCTKEELLDFYKTSKDPKKSKKIKWNFILNINGKQRELTDTEKKFKKLLKKINNMLASIKLPKEFKGGVKGESIYANGSPHIGNKYMINIDLKNFYPSLNRNDIRKLFIEIGCIPSVAEILTKLTTTSNNGVPQGYPTSTIIGNLFLANNYYPAIKKVIEKNGYKMSIWIDDITISSKTYISNIARQEILSELRRPPIKINKKKLKILGPRDKKNVTGTIISTKVNLDKKTIRDIEKDLNIASKYGLAEITKKHPEKTDKTRKKYPKRPLEEIGRGHLKGKLSNIKMINPCKYKKILKKNHSNIKRLKLAPSKDLTPSPTAHHP